MNPFEQFVAFADRTGQVRKPITQTEFESWKQQYTFDALQGTRYGESFCNHFGITDNILYHSCFVTVEECDQYIRKSYVHG
jgi:hypothetical protein